MVMDARAKTIKPLLDQVVLEFIGIPETIMQPGLEEGDAPVEQTFIKTRAIIRELGPDLTEKNGVKVGDWVLFDGANVMAVDIEDYQNEGVVLKFGICGVKDVLGIYEEV